MNQVLSVVIALGRNGVGILVLAGAGLVQGGCSESNGPSRIVAVEEEHGGVLSFEEYRAAAEREVDGRTVYNVEWDLFFTSERDLREHYLQRLNEELDKSVVITSGGNDLTWGRNTTALHLRYCVSNTFGAVQAAVVSGMAAATMAWQDVANVHFAYDPSQNAACAGPGPQIDFAVIPLPGTQLACATPPFLPPQALAKWCPNALGTLGIDFAAWPWISNGTPVTTTYPNLTTTGVLRHELGHMLGLRHEHPWAPGAGGCPETPVLCPTCGVSGRQLTNYDQNSVMQYPWCNGNPNTSFSLSALDGVGVRELYGMPAAWYFVLDG